MLTTISKIPVSVMLLVLLVLYIFATGQLP
jgi:hypothetical protein